VAKLNDEAKKKYVEHVSPYKKFIADLQSKENRIEGILKNSDPGESYKRLTLAEDNLTMVSYNLVMNALSVTLLGIKNENALNDAKKGCSLAIIQLEKVFTDLLDVPFGDYEESLKATASFSEIKRYDLIRKTGLSLSLVNDSFGENNKYKWTLVDLNGRLAVVAKNCLDLRTLVQGMDPRIEGYRERVEFFNLSRRMLKDSADNYRKKYELSTKRMEDFRRSISFLGALLRLSMLLGRQNEAVELRRKIDIWKRKMESDNKNREDVARIARLGGGET
jgi:hypothetical protein